MLYRNKPLSLIANDNIGKERVEVTLVFGRSQHLPFLNRFLKDGFAHVRICIHRKDYTVLIDPRLAYNYVECYAGNVKIVPNDGETVVRFKRMIHLYKVRRFFGPLNCVETAKAFIGDTAFWCLTPYQLYKRVKNYGCH